MPISDSYKKKEEATAAHNEITRSYHRVRGRGLYFLAIVFLW